MYPKVRAKVGKRALYADSPARHIMVEFAFDVLQVASGGYAAQAYRDRIGFEVAKPLLERAFRATYDLELKDLFGDEDLAIGTYRHAIGTVIPEMTRLAWEDKQDEILARTPDAVRDKFVFTLTREEYDARYGTQYKKPGLMTRVFFYFMKIIPKVGPFRPLAFEPLTPEAERLFARSFETSRERFRGWYWRCAKRRYRWKTAISTPASRRIPVKTRSSPRRTRTWRSYSRSSWQPGGWVTRWR